MPECKTYCSTEGTYANSKTAKCELCLHGCKTCASGDFNSCMSCQDGFYLQEEYQICDKCPSECLTCSNL